MGRRITLRPQADYEVVQQERAQEDTYGLVIMFWGVGI